MIYINFVELYFLCFMPSFKIIGLLVVEKKILNVCFFFVFYSHGGNLGHVTWAIHTNIRSPFLRMLHMKFAFDWLSGFRGDL